MIKSRFEVGLRAQQAAERIGGKVMETEDGFVVETTIGGLTKYNISRQITNMNTHCAVAAVTRPLHDTDAEVYIVFEMKQAWEYAKGLLEKEIKRILVEDMNDEIEWIVCPIEELLDNETPCWLSVTENGCDLDGWYTVENHHHKVKFTRLYELTTSRREEDKDELPF